VDVGHGLPSSGSIVDSNVEAHVSKWNDEAVPRGHRVPISNPDRVFIAPPNPLGGQLAKRTAVIASVRHRRCIPYLVGPFTGITASACRSLSIQGAAAQYLKHH
jgi:hypothetical protein